MALNIFEITEYVNLDVDDSFQVQEVARWFNRGIASYNLIPPLSEYPFIDPEEDDEVYEGLDMNFMLGVMVPFISSMVRAQESAIMEQENYYNEFMMNARMYKTASNVPKEFLKVKVDDIEDYQIGENVYISDMDYAPFTNQWHRPVKRVKKHDPLSED